MRKKYLNDEPFQTEKSAIETQPYPEQSLQAIRQPKKPVASLDDDSDDQDLARLQRMID